MKNRFRIGITIFLLLLTIGFSIVTTNLIVNNLTNISLTPDDFNVYFSKAITNDRGSASISSNNKIITYSTNTLVNIGDKAELTYRITNDSKQYDALINLAINFDNIEDKDRFKITYITFSDQDSYLLEAKTSEEGKVIIELLKPYIKDTSVSFNITIDAEAKSRSSIASGENYNLIFDSQGGSEVENKTVEYGHQYGDLSTPTKNGFTFLGWYRGDDLVSEDTFIDNNNEILEAHWERNNYNINIDLNGGSSNQSLSYNIPYESEIELSVPTRNNYIFDGWESNIDSTIINGNLIKMGYNDTTIKAKWKPMSYYVKFNGNGSTSGSMANQEIEWNKETQLLANTFIKTNYTFAGWSTTSNGVIEYLDNENILNLTTSGETITLYAIWVKTTTTYNYYGAYQIFNTPQKGYYQIEVYGAAGGGPGNCNGYAIKAGGYGGYAKGTTSLNKGEKIYIVAGGKGGMSTTYGFNGGGYNAQAGNNCGGAGGGATHVASVLRGNGQLSNYASYQNEVLIAAGAGGGGALSVAGAAGGTNSGKLYYLSGGNGTPTGPGAAGTGYTHYSGQTAGSFGKGGNGGSYGVGAGGAGWYGGGGGAHITPTTSGGGGGGSTYIKSTLTNQAQTAGVNSGNGYVIITFISGLK